MKIANIYLSFNREICWYIFISYKIIIYNIRFASGDWVSLTQPSFAHSSSLKITVAIPRDNNTTSTMS